MFAFQKLQDQVFCLTEERDYFQTKFLEQVSEIASLKEELGKARREISKLRNEILERSGGGGGKDVVDLRVVHTHPSSQSNDVDDDRSAASSLTSDDNGNDEEQRIMTPNRQTHDDDDDDEADSAKDIRQSAEKLLQWAQYRTSVGDRDRGGSSSSHAVTVSPSLSPSLSVVARQPHQTLPLLGGMSREEEEEEEELQPKSLYDEDEDEEKKVEDFDKEQENRNQQSHGANQESSNKVKAKVVQL
jgi:hypothetical protein